MANDQWLLKAFSENWANHTANVPTFRNTYQFWFVNVLVVTHSMKHLFKIDLVISEWQKYHIWPLRGSFQYFCPMVALLRRPGTKCLSACESLHVRACVCVFACLFDSKHQLLVVNGACRPITVSSSSVTGRAPPYTPQGIEMRTLAWPQKGLT